MILRFNFVYRFKRVTQLFYGNTIVLYNNIPFAFFNNKRWVGNFATDESRLYELMACDM